MQTESLVQNLHNKIITEVRCSPLTSPVETYVGPMSHRVQGFCCEADVSDLWRLDPKKNCYVSDSFEDLIDLLKDWPLGKVGMTPNSTKNLRFLQRELGDWLDSPRAHDKRAPWEFYCEMWEGIPNVSENAYSRLAKASLSRLLDLTECIWCSRHNFLSVATPTPEGTVEMQNYSKVFHSLNRYIMLRFGPSNLFCPISWQTSLNNPYEAHMNIILNFRSLEVSRNLLNDLFLFLGFFGYIWGQKPLIEDTDKCKDCVCKPPKDIQLPEDLLVKRVILTSGDAHIIEIS